MNEQNSSFSMPGVAFEVSEIGTLRIGGTQVYRPGAELKMADEFSVTTLEQRGGAWLPHEVQESLPRDAAGLRRVIPIMLPYDDPDLVIQSRLTAFDKDACRVACRSTSQGQARRRVGEEVIDVPCAGPDECSFAQGPNIQCQWFGKLRVHIDASGSDTSDPTQVFVLRSAGFNTLRTVEAAIRQYHAALGGKLRGVKFKLVMNAATTATSQWQRFEFVTLSLNGQSLITAAKAATALQQDEQAVGVNAQALEAAVRAGVLNSEFAATSFEGLLAAEFFPVDQPDELVEAGTASQVEPGKASAAWSFAGLSLPSFPS